MLKESINLCYDLSISNTPCLSIIIIIIDPIYDAFTFLISYENVIASTHKKKTFGRRNILFFASTTVRFR